MRLYVLSEDGFSAHPLPAEGRATVGSAAGCDVRVAGPGVAGRHARLHLGSPLGIERLGEAEVELRGQSLPPGQVAELVPGELVRAGSVQLLIERRRSAPPRRFASHGYFEQRVEEECHRADRTRRSFTVVRIRVEAAAERAAVEAALARSTRQVDAIAACGAAEYELLLCETAPEQAAVVVGRVCAALAALGAQPVFGQASYPRDGHDATSLLQAAAPPGEAGRPRAEAARARAPRGKAMEDVQQLVERVARSDLSVLVLGETGVGKERVAEAVHRCSPRAGRPLLRLNCAALGESLLESELFGHERGSFTGAQERKRGLLESAGGGTVFLDEVGDMPLPTQTKLLRVLEERRVRRVGGLESIAIDVRFVAATNRDLTLEIARGAFRQDLYFRLDGVSVVVPPLRERAEEIADLVDDFLAEACARLRRPALTCSPEALRLLRAYPWPGNVRELRSVVERAAVLCDGDAIVPAHLPAEKIQARFAVPAPTSAAPPPSAEVAAAVPSALRGRLSPRERDEVLARERQRIVEALSACAGNQTEAAAQLGLSRRTLINRIAEYGLPRPRKRAAGLD